MDCAEDADVDASISVDEDDTVVPAGSTDGDLGDLVNDDVAASPTDTTEEDPCPRTTAAARRPLLEPLETTETARRPRREPAGISAPPTSTLQ